MKVLYVRVRNNRHSVPIGSNDGYFDNTHLVRHENPFQATPLPVSKDIHTPRRHSLSQPTAHHIRQVVVILLALFLDEAMKSKMLAPVSLYFSLMLGVSVANRN